MPFRELESVKPAVEGPTAALAAAIYGGWFALTYNWRALPIWAVCALGAILVAWHMSLQHEIIHNHPTKWRRVNRAIGTWPLALWLPYEIYRITHLQHHNDNRLTDPLEDPESYYYTPEQWRALSPLARRLSRAQATLLGRITLGPAWAIGRFWVAEIPLLVRRRQKRLAIVSRHLFEAALVLAWVIGVCGMPLWLYLFGFVYLGTALALVRSFAEHRADDAVERRTAIVERAWLLGPLSLFNNLHVVHHLRSELPWYRIPRWYRLNREAVLARNGGLVYRSYFDVARRYLLKPHDAAVHPEMATKPVADDQIPAYQS
jgi:fatty acid desaturase